MITNATQRTLSPYADLYDILLSPDDTFRRMRNEVDYSFIYDELKDKYCRDNGRNAINPIYLFKCLILKTLSDLSDEDLMTEIKHNMAWKYFLDMNPEDMPPHASTLCVFRRKRLADDGLMEKLLDKTLQMAVESGIALRSADGKVHVNVIIDGTHTVSSNGCHRPVPALKEYTRKLRRLIYEHDPATVNRIASDKEYREADLEREIKYVEDLLLFFRSSYGELMIVPKFSRVYNRLAELLDDVLDHYTVSSTDPDARLGHKTADTEFFGYKTQVAIDESSGLIIGAACVSGEVNDAIPGLEVLKDIAANEDFKVEEVLADTAYSGQPFLEFAAESGFAMIAPSHPFLGRNIDGRDGFTFNKDADMFCCPQGHLAQKKRIVTHKKDNYRQSLVYSFDPRHCSICPFKSQCIKGNAKYRTFSVTKLTKEQKDLLDRQKTKYFKDRRRQRYKIEQTNSHLKQSYGMRQTKGKGMQMMTVQAAVAFFTHNVKLILDKKARK